MSLMNNLKQHEKSWYTVRHISVMDNTLKYGWLMIISSSIKRLIC